MNELIFTQSNLPTTIKELEKYIAIGKEQLKARQAQIRAYDKIEAAETTKKAVLENAQNEADTLLDAEVKLGELVAKRPRNKPFAVKDSGSLMRTTVSDLPPTIDKKESHHLQAIAANKEVVEQVKTQ